MLSGKKRETEKDELIEFLYRKAAALERVVNQIDRDVAEAVVKYLKEYKPAFLGERVTFAKFLAILEGEMTRAICLDLANSKDSHLRKAMEKSVREEFEKRLSTEILGNELSVVVFVVREKEVETGTGIEKRPVYKASCVEREISIEGDSKDDVIKKWYHRLRCKLGGGPITRFPFPSDPKLKLKRCFEEGKLLDHERVGPYGVTVNGYPAKIFEG